MKNALKAFFMEIMNEFTSKEEQEEDKDMNFSTFRNTIEAGNSAMYVYDL